MGGEATTVKVTPLFTKADFPSNQRPQVGYGHDGPAMPCHLSSQSRVRKHRPCAGATEAGQWVEGDGIWGEKADQ
ncbi:unnamed protein product [Merluccius merluccius]